MRITTRLLLTIVLCSQFQAVAALAVTPPDDHLLCYKAGDTAIFNGFLRITPSDPA